MSKEYSSIRRRFLALLGTGGAAAMLLGTLPSRALAAALPHLSVDTNATAKALHYTEDASTAPAPYQAGQDCSNCTHYQGKAGEAYGPCALFPGFAVNAKGWCAGYSPKA